MTIRVGGDDRLTFLQGQLTQDLTALTAAGSLPGAWCNPKGRVLATLRLIDAGDCVHLVAPATSEAELQRRLAMYRLRADVSLDTNPALAALAFSAETFAERAAALLPPAGESCRNADGVCVVRPLPTAAYVEVYGHADALRALDLDTTAALSVPDWHAARIGAGLVEIGAEVAEQFTPHMLNLDRTGYLSFEKGCYTGQEVVARTEHLGRVKRRINRYRLDGATAAPGDRLTADGADLGTVVNACEHEVLAIVPVDRHRDTLTIGAGTATPLPLAYPIEP